MGVKRAEIRQPLESGDLARDLTLPRRPKFENFVVEADAHAWLLTGTIQRLASSSMHADASISARAPKSS